MDDMELDQTPAQQPEDPFNGDSSVASGQTVQAEPVKQEAWTQPQPAAEAVSEEKPKWQKIVGTVSTILIAVTGILAALFMCLLSYNIVSYNIFGNKTTASVMLSDVTKSINEAADYMAEYMDQYGSDAPMSGLAGAMSSILFNGYIMFAMLMGIITGIICGIMLIIKSVKQFAMKKQTTLEKTAITSCLFFFAEAAILLSVSMRYMKDGSDVAGTNQYGATTLAGLIICGIFFAAYFIGKIVSNYQFYKNDKKTLINGCFNLAWAVIAMLVLALLTCAPVMAAEDGVSSGYGFNYVFAQAFRAVLAASENTDADLTSEVTQYMYAAVGMLVQIWFIFQCGKSLHGAMRGTITADKAVKLGSQIWRLIFSVIYLIVCAGLSKAYFGDGISVSLAAPIVILVFSVIGLAIAIVNKVLVKEKAEKHDI